MIEGARKTSRKVMDVLMSVVITDSAENRFQGNHPSRCGETILILFLLCRTHRYAKLVWHNVSNALVHIT
jgi:hypothetical protein